MRNKGECVCASVCELIIDGGKKMKNERIRKMQERGKASVLRRMEALISLANGHSETHCMSVLREKT